MLLTGHALAEKEQKILLLWEDWGVLTKEGVVKLLAGELKSDKGSWRKIKKTLLPPNLSRHRGEKELWLERMPAPVPEPCTLLLMGSGLAGLGLLRRRGGTRLDR